MTYRNTHQFPPENYDMNGMSGPVTTREEFAALVESCKATNLPKTATWEDRRRIEPIMRRALGWMKSGFFSMESRETQQHVEYMRAALARVNGGL